MTKTAGKKAIAGFIAASISLGAPLGMATVANAQVNPEQSIDNESPTYAEEHPFNYLDMAHSPEQDLTNEGTTFSPQVSEVTPVNFSITHAEDENGNDITENLGIDPLTGVITVNADIGDENILYYFIEVRGTYADGSNHADRMFVINERFTTSLPTFSVPLGETLTISNEVVDHFTKVGNAETSYVYSDNTPDWVVLGNGINIKTNLIPGENEEEKVGRYDFDILRVDNVTGETTVVPVTINVSPSEEDNPTYIVLDESSTILTQADLAHITGLNLMGPVFDLTEETPEWVQIDSNGNITVNTVGEEVEPGTYTIPLNAHSASTPDEIVPVELNLTVLNNEIDTGLPTPPENPGEEPTAPFSSSLPKFSDVEKVINGISFLIAVNTIIENLENFNLVNNVENSIHAINRDIQNFQNGVENFQKHGLNNLLNFSERRDQRLEELGLKELFDRRQADRIRDNYERFDQEKINRLISLLRSYQDNNSPQNPVIDNTDINPDTTPGENDIIIDGEIIIDENGINTDVDVNL